MGITFLRGSNTSGIYAGLSSNNFYNFTYIYNGTSSNMTISPFVKSFSTDARSTAFSAYNTRLVLGGANYNITLYTTGFVAYCSSQITSS